MLGLPTLLRWRKLTARGCQSTEQEIRLGQNGRRVVGACACRRAVLTPACFASGGIDVLILARGAQEPSELVVLNAGAGDGENCALRVGLIPHLIDNSPTYANNSTAGQAGSPMQASEWPLLKVLPRRMLLIVVCS